MYTLRFRNNEVKPKLKIVIPLPSEVEPGIHEELQKNNGFSSYLAGFVPRDEPHEDPAFLMDAPFDLEDREEDVTLDEKKMWDRIDGFGGCILGSMITFAVITVFSICISLSNTEQQQPQMIQVRWEKFSAPTGAWPFYRNRTPEGWIIKKDSQVVYVPDKDGTWLNLPEEKQCKAVMSADGRWCCIPEEKQGKVPVMSADGRWCHIPEEVNVR